MIIATEQIYQMIYCEKLNKIEKIPLQQENKFPWWYILAAFVIQLCIWFTVKEKCVYKLNVDVL